MTRTTLLPEGWDSEDVFIDGDAWYDGVLAAIAAARRSVWVETYAVGNDAIGRQLIAALTAAAARGCAVRLLVDGVGSAEWVRAVSTGAWPTLAASPLAVRVWHPLPWVVARRVRLFRRWSWLRRINRRDHRKICIIDAAEAWVGSINWDAVHSRRESGDAVWRDNGARVAGAGVAALEVAMARGWRQAWTLSGGRIRFPWRSTSGMAVAICPSVRLNYSIAVRRAAYHDLRRRLGAAQRRIWISNAYVVPRGSFLSVLEAAAIRGVDVRLMGPGISDHAVMPWIVALFADALSAAGARVFAYRPRVLHAKTMIIDDTALVGSHNLNSRSFLHDLESEVVLSRPEAVERLAEAYLADLEQADELRPPALARLRWWQRLAAHVALLAKRWL